MCQQHGTQQVGVSSTVTIHFKDVFVFSNAGLLSYPVADGCFSGVASLFPAVGHYGTLCWRQARGQSSMSKHTGELCRIYYPSPSFLLFYPSVLHTVVVVSPTVQCKECCWYCSIGADIMPESEDEPLPLTFPHVIDACMCDLQLPPSTTCCTSSIEQIGAVSHLICTCKHPSLR